MSRNAILRRFAQFRILKSPRSIDRAHVPIFFVPPGTRPYFFRATWHTSLKNACLPFCTKPISGYPTVRAGYHTCSAQTAQSEEGRVPPGTNKLGTCAARHETIRDVCHTARKNRDVKWHGWHTNGTDGTQMARPEQGRAICAKCAMTPPHPRHAILRRWMRNAILRRSHP